MYKGQPAYVRRTPALGLLTVPSRDACTPLPAIPCAIPEGSTTGGQYFVQFPVAVHTTLPFFSDARMYRVWPFPLTNTAPSPGTSVTLTVTEAGDTLSRDDLVGEPTVEEEEAGPGDLLEGDDALLDGPHEVRRINVAPRIRNGRVLAR